MSQIRKAQIIADRVAISENQRMNLRNLREG